MLFASTELVRRIERAEAASLHAILTACDGAPLAMPLGGGLALYRGPDSPLNKVVGLGFAPLDDAALAQVEDAYFERGTPVQVELATHADPAVSALLARRGYVPSGFENVLGRALGDVTETPSTDPLAVRRAAADELDAWVDVLTTGFFQRDGSAPVASHDLTDRALLERTFRDMALQPNIEHWVALWDGRVAGGASMSIRDGITQLFGAATHPTVRRRGIQSALLQARLCNGRDRGADLAVITTQPGSKSQQNAVRTGFSLLYAREVWVRLPAR